MFFRRVLSGSFALVCVALNEDPGDFFVVAVGRFLDLALLAEEPTIGELSDADRFDLLRRLDSALLYPVAVRKSLGVVESSRLEFELYRRAKPPGLGDGLPVGRHPERLATFEAVVILKADSQAAVSVRFQPCHFAIPPSIPAVDRVASRVV